jgi:O-antigen/teichoic acid export membrane protein
MMEIVAMPLIIRLLYTEEFVAAAPMAIYATFYLFFKAMTLPVAYLALAKGDSKTFFFAELLYSIFAVFIVPFLFTRYGLNGAGMALSLAGLFDLLLIYCFYGVKYGFRLALRPMKTYVLQALLLGLCVYVSVSFEGQTKWMLGGLSLLVSASLSLCQLYLKTDVWKSKVRKSE